MARNRRRRREKPKGEFPHVWARDRLPEGRKGKPCRIIRKGAIPECAVIEFEDGKTFEVLRRYVWNRSKFEADQIVRREEKGPAAVDRAIEELAGRQVAG